MCIAIRGVYAYIFSLRGYLTACFSLTLSRVFRMLICILDFAAIYQKFTARAYDIATIKTLANTTFKNMLKLKPNYSGGGQAVIVLLMTRSPQWLMLGI